MANYKRLIAAADTLSLLRGLDLQTGDAHNVRVELGEILLQEFHTLRTPEDIVDFLDYVKGDLHV